MSTGTSLHIVLAGPRAVGKTTIGRALAVAQSSSFIDLDDRVLATFDEPSVSEAWRVHGEGAWREAECAVLEQVLGEAPAVVALGGGVPAVPQAARQLNRARDAGRALVLQLEADPGLLAERLAASAGDRPSLTGADPAEEIAEICAERAEAYASVADYSVRVDDRSMEDILQEITVLLAQS